MMMYMSKIRLNQGPEIFKYLEEHGNANCYSDHQMLWRLFPDDPDAQRDFLFRKEVKNGHPVYYVVSKRIPVSNDFLFHVETKEYNPRIKKGQSFSFCLRVNPVVAKKNEGSKNSKRHDIWMNAWREGKTKGLSGADLYDFINTRAKQWLIGREKEIGASINSDGIIIEGYTRHKFYGNKMKRIIHLGILDYHGIVRVNDEEIMCNALFNGIGKAKAFGCGLLLIKPV